MYDPTEDPRYVPIEPDIPQQERDILETGIAEAEASIKHIDQMLLMFAQPGWEGLAEGLERVADDLDTQLKSEKDMGTWKFYRGQLAQIDWLRGLPTEMADRQRKLRRDHAALLQMLGKE